MSLKQEIIEKYPQLIDENIKEYMVDCPPGWHNIVMNLCGAIDQYSKSYVGETRPRNKVRYYFWFWLRAAINAFQHKLFIKVINKPEINRLFNIVRNRLSVRMHKHTKFAKVYPPTIQIQQVKEKYGTLRFYYSGGDAKVIGMVALAEFISSVTCEVTGRPGMPHVRGYWYKTLNEDVPKTDPKYEGYVPVKQNTVV